MKENTIAELVIPKPEGRCLVIDADFEPIPSDDMHHLVTLNSYSRTKSESGDVTLHHLEELISLEFEKEYPDESIESIREREYDDCMKILKHFEGKYEERSMILNPYIFGLNLWNRFAKEEEEKHGRDTE